MKSDSKNISDNLPEIDSLWDYMNPSETEAKFRLLIPQAKSNKNYHAELLTQIARTQSLQFKFDEAHTILDSVDLIIDSSMKVPRIRYHLERGRAFNSANQKEKAVEHFNTAYQLAQASNEDFHTVDAAHMLAIAESSENQLKWNLIALEHSEKSEDVKAKKWIGSLYNNIGWTYHDSKEFDRALNYFEKALNYRKEQKDTVRTFIAEWTVARTYRSLNKIEEAIVIQESLAKQMEEGKVELDGYVYEELGECYLRKNQKSESKPYFKLAYDLLSQDKWLVANESDRLNRLKKLSL